MRHVPASVPTPPRRTAPLNGDRLARAATVLALAALAAAGCSGGDPDRDDLVLLVSLDTTPADHVGCYGYPQVRTPWLDRLARRGLQVMDAVAPAPLTLPSHATMLTGVDPPEHGARENGVFVVPDSMRTVPERLPAGTPSAAFVGAFPLAARFGLDQGFGTYDADFGAQRDRRQPPERRAADVFAAAGKWIAAQPPSARPFVWTHVYDAHYAYAAPPPWPRAARTLAEPGRFEGEVSYVDHELGRFLQGLAREGRRPRVLVTADHGESLGRHDEYSHGIFVYDVTQRIPMIWCGPGIRPRLEVEQRTLRDVAPTLLATLGGDLSGMSGAPLESPAGEAWAYVETKHTELMRGWAPLYGIRTERWKYIRAPRPELYDLLADPGEVNNVLGAHGDEAERLSVILDGVLASEAGRAPASLDERTAEQLRALGYVAAISDPRRADLRKDPKDGALGAAAQFLGEEAYLAGDLPRAEKHLLEAIRLDPEAKEAHSFLSGTYMSQGRAKEAAEQATTALRLEPHLNEAPLHATLGEALLALDRPVDAIPHLKIAQAAARGSTRVARMLADAEARAK